MATEGALSCTTSLYEDEMESLGEDLASKAKVKERGRGQATCDSDFPKQTGNEYKYIHQTNHVTPLGCRPRVGQGGNLECVF